MIYDILQTVVDYGKLTNQIKLMKMDSYIYNNIHIHKVLDSHNLTQKILEQKKFSKLRVLNCDDNDTITNVKGKNLFPFNPRPITMVSCKSSSEYIRRIKLLWYKLWN